MSTANDKLIGVYKHPETVQIVIALFVLSIGVLVYLLDRQPGSVYFIPEWFSLTGNPGSIFGYIGNHLPTFIHVYVFILLTVSTTAVSVSHACILWFVIDSLLEIAQLTTVANWIAENIPAWFAGIPFFENTASYFKNGTFDVLDIVSIVLGTVAAYLTFQFTRKERQS